jgi:hypothetical protein
MSAHPGAIVLIVYYALVDLGKTQSWFSAAELFRRIQTLRSSPTGKSAFDSFTQQYMKHHRKDFPKTLTTEARLKGWLGLHVSGKPVYWFEERPGSFRLKREHLSRLSNYMP